MMRVVFSIFSVFLLFIFITSTVSAQSRPKIGLVLSGGGAKGSAHIGVLKVLEQYHIPVDYVVGTSIGAYVGGLYALGYSAEEVEFIMMSLPWDDGYSDFIPRESLGYEDKQLRDKYNISLRLGYSDSQFKIPKGLLLGQTVEQLMQQSTDLVANFSSFDDLAVPYRAIASDLATAESVVLDSGSLGKAMKASAAVPGIVSAIEVNGMLLVDGGITNNFPIDVVKKMGADIVIAVDIGSPLVDASELTSTLEVINQLSTILTNNTTLAQMANLSEQDILLRPAIDKLSTTDFSIMPEALYLGEKVALKHINELTKHSISETEYLRYQQEKKAKRDLEEKAIEQPITAINLLNNSKVHDGIIMRHFNINVGDVVTQKQLRSAIDRVYALDTFEQVNASFFNTPQGRTIVLTTDKKSWGPNYINIGLSIKSDFSKDSIFSFNLAYLLKDITPNGGQWLNEVQLGWETQLATELYQPLSQEQEYFLRGRVEYSLDKWEATEDRSEITKTYFQGNLSLGINYSDYGAIEAGLLGEKGDISPDSPEAQKYDYRSLGGYVTINYDTLNSINFPTKGHKFSFDVLMRNDKYNPFFSSDNNQKTVQVKLDYLGAFGFDNHTIVGIGSFSTVVTDSDFTVHLSELGGFLNLSSYQQDALIGAHKVFTALVYQYDLGRTVPGSSELPIYLGTSIEVGQIWQLDETVSLSNLISSGSVYVGTDTSFGPAVFGVGLSIDGEYTAFLSVGKNW